LNILKIFCDKNNLNYTHTSYSEGTKTIENNFHYLLACDINKDENILVMLSSKLDEMLIQLDMITKLYFRNYSFDRSECDIKFSDLKKYTRRKGTLIIFPDFKKHHIVAIAKNNHRLPAGISRHRIFNRVLHVKYEIKKLKSDSNIAAKTEELKNMLLEKINKNKVRQYQESVIVFDE
jgi:hypothetical protein